MKANIFYGISGTFKETTIKSKLGEDDIPVWSSIKIWKELEESLPSEYGIPGNLKFALLHLTNLQRASKENKNLYIERGVTDMLFFETLKLGGLREGIVTSSVNKESELLAEFDVTRILLVMKDREFIRQYILSNKYRREVLPGDVSDYLEKQESYINFTKSINKIDETIIIDNAETYLNSLGLEFKINY